VDGVPWPHQVGTPGAIAAGEHVLACGTEVRIRIDAGRTFRFEYWGP
jgi:hypothetical protein